MLNQISPDATKFSKFSRGRPPQTPPHKRGALPLSCSPPCLSLWHSPNAYGVGFNITNILAMPLCGKE